jgi:cupin 2 domain-containing protein
MFRRHNLFHDIPETLPDELIQILQQGGGVRIERIVSQGHASPAGFWYDQPEDEWVILLRGAARLRFDNEQTFDLSPGDYVIIPAHTRHRVEWTDPNVQTVWLAVHYRAFGPLTHPLP